MYWQVSWLLFFSASFLKQLSAFFPVSFWHCSAFSGSWVCFIFALQSWGQFSAVSPCSQKLFPQHGIIGVCTHTPFMHSSFVHLFRSSQSPGHVASSFFVFSSFVISGISVSIFVFSFTKNCIDFVFIWLWQLSMTVSVYVPGFAVCLILVFIGMLAFSSKIMLFDGSCVFCSGPVMNMSIIAFASLLLGFCISAVTISSCPGVSSVVYGFNVSFSSPSSGGVMIFIDIIVSIVRTAIIMNVISIVFVVIVFFGCCAFFIASFISYCVYPAFLNMLIIVFKR